MLKIRDNSCFLLSPAGNIHQSPGNVGRLLRQQPQNGLGNFFRLTAALHWDGIFQARHPAIRLEVISKMPAGLKSRLLPEFSVHFFRHRHHYDCKKWPRLRATSNLFISSAIFEMTSSHSYRFGSSSIRLTSQWRHGVLLCRFFFLYRVGHKKSA